MLESVKQGIESAGAKLVPVAAQLLDEPKTKNRFFGGVVKDMKSNQAAVKVLVIVALSRSLFHCVVQISATAIAIPKTATDPATTLRNALIVIISSSHFPMSVPRKAERIVANR